MTSPRFACADCGVDVLSESYMLRNTLWRAATAGRPARFLCVGCLESRIGRQIDRHDFAPLAINLYPSRSSSPRLLDRLAGFADAMGTASLRSLAEIREANAANRAPGRRKPEDRNR